MKGKLLIILSILSILTVTGWLITEFYGGIVIYIIMYWWIIAPLIIIYAITFLITFIKIIRNGIKSNKFLFYTHTLGVLMIIIFSLYQSELFKSRILLDATMVDDLNSINLVLRENGKFETTTNGMFGFTDKISGKYLKHNDTIIFLKRPYSNDFIPGKVLIDKQDSAIYFKRDSKGGFSREKTFVNYFRIDKNEL
jgi:hypothetical protein